MGTSLYSVSPATWVSDRPTVMVALVLNITLLLLLSVKVFSRWMTAFIYGCLFLFAFLSKESGLIVPLSAAVIAFLLKKSQHKWIMGTAGVSVAAYLIFRALIFRGQAFSYSESGYLFGWVFYPDNVPFPFYLQALVYADNVLKNIAANILTVFGPEGGFLPWADAQLRIGMIVSIFLVFLAAVSRRKTGAFGGTILVILILNALIHFQLFRYRALYLGFEAIMLFVGASFINRDWSKHKASLVIITVLLLAVIGSNMVYVQDHLLNQSFKRSREMNRYELTTVIAERGDQISADILEQVLDRYKKK
jgi:hypothetical protein